MNDRKNPHEPGSQRSHPPAAGPAVAGAADAGMAEPMTRKAYDKALKKLHVQRVQLQQWVVRKGLKVCIVFERRDGAGQGGASRP